MGWDLTKRWLAGGRIVAGTGMAGEDGVQPWVDGSRVARECTHGGCGTTVFGSTRDEAEARMDRHEERCHGS
jgi:hypothetical protein